MEWKREGRRRGRIMIRRVRMSVRRSDDEPPDSFPHSLLCCVLRITRWGTPQVRCLFQPQGSSYTTSSFPYPSPLCCPAFLIQRGKNKKKIVSTTKCSASLHDRIGYSCEIASTLHSIPPSHLHFSSLYTGLAHPAIEEVVGKKVNDEKSYLPTNCSYRGYRSVKWIVRMHWRRHTLDRMNWGQETHLLHSSLIVMN